MEPVVYICNEKSCPSYAHKYYCQSCMEKGKHDHFPIKEISEEILAVAETYEKVRDLAGGLYKGVLSQITPYKNLLELMEICKEKAMERGIYQKAQVLLHECLVREQYQRLT